MAQIIRAKGMWEEVQPKNGTDFQLDELQTIVGGYIEIKPVNEREIICMDEEGNVKGKDINILATAMFQAYYNTKDFVVGDVLLCYKEEIK